MSRAATDAGQLWLLQLVDGSFPNGAFADSRGLEALWRSLGLSREALEEAIVAACCTAVARADAWFAAAALRAVRGTDAAALRAVAEDDLCSRPSALQRAASLRKGAATLRVAAAAAAPAQARRIAWAEQALGARHPYATTLGAVAAAGGVDARALRLGVLHAEASGMTSALVKLGLLTPSAAQATSRRAARAALDAFDDDAGWSSFAPLLEIGAMRHEALAQRLFES